MVSKQAQSLIDYVNSRGFAFFTDDDSDDRGIVGISSDAIDQAVEEGHLIKACLECEGNDSFMLFPTGTKIKNVYDYSYRREFILQEQQELSEKAG